MNKDWDTPEGRVIVDKIVNMSLHKDLHIPIIGYAYREDGTKVMTKAVDRWVDNCPYCDDERPKPIA